MNFFHHKDLGNHLLQLCSKVVEHPVYVLCNTTEMSHIKGPFKLLTGYVEDTKFKYLTRNTS